MKNLISMTDFVLETYNNVRDAVTSENLMFDYANFLKQPLELWMFVPCNEKGNVLEEPEIYKITAKTGTSKEELQWIQAKERCLFLSQHGNEEMFDESLARVYLDEFFNIEQLSNEIRLIKLTPTALKQLAV